jgi:hypothetical protein
LRRRAGSNDRFAADLCYLRFVDGKIVERREYE